MRIAAKRDAADVVQTRQNDEEREKERVSERVSGGLQRGPLAIGRCQLV
jgi:hypothetical protein